MSRPTNRGRAGKPVVRRRKKASIVDRLMARIPLGHAALHRIATWSIVVLALGGIYIAGRVSGINGRVGTALAEQVGKAGLRVDQIETRGSPHMDVMTVNAIALKDQSRSMLLYDADKTRTNLMEYGWVKDAQVSKRLPNIVLIRIVERTPAAIWQYQGALNLVDRDGNFIEEVSADAMPDLPLVIGPGADKQEPAYQTLMEAAPALKPRVRAATWVGNRRWDLLFDTGETLSLPEEGAAAALKLFAGKDATHPLLGRGFVKFDLRDPTRMVVRKPEPGMRTPEPTPTARPTAIKSGRATTRSGPGQV